MSEWVYQLYIRAFAISSHDALKSVDTHSNEATLAVRKPINYDREKIMTFRNSFKLVCGGPLAAVELEKRAWTAAGTDSV